MSQLPNNSSSFIAQVPLATSYGQTFHKQNFETDGTSTHLNINNDENGVYTGSSGGFKFSTINSTLNGPKELLYISSDGLTINNVLQAPISHIIVKPSPFYYGINTAPDTSATILTTYGYSGWHYSSSLPDRITWAFRARKNATVGDLKGISVSFFNVSVDTKININVNVTNGSKGYKTPILTANTSYQGVAILATNQVPNNETTVVMQPGTPVGTYLPTSLITSVVIETSTSMTSNEFVISKLNLHYTDSVTSYQLN